jgi:L-asparaginase
MTKPDASRPRIAVFSLGGTIAMSARAASGVVPGLDAGDLLAAVPEAGSIGEIEAVAVRRAPSVDLQFADVAELAAAIARARAEGIDGAVVTQGTDTLEESAFLLDLLLEPGAPVVVTGAMRNPTLPGADGAANLLAALRTAACPAAAGAGVLVVLNDEIHAARWVRKAHAHRPSAFASPSVGPVGWIVEERVRLALRPVRALPVLPWRGEPPFVPILAVGLGSGPRDVEALAQAKPAGLVIAAAGAGHVPSTAVEALARLAEDIPVVFASRTGAGETCRTTYAYPGSESDLLNRGLIGAGALDPLKARILLVLLLADGADRSRISEMFAAA